MATLSQAINQHWHNKNGGFAINYRLYAYESRTTTILDTYKDATETSKHTHPIIIQPNGKVPGEGIFLKDGAGVSYTFILKDDFDVEISTVNDVTAASLSTEFHNFITQEENTIDSLADTSYLTSILLDNSNDDSFRAVIYTDDNLNGYSTNNFTIDTIDEISYSNIWGTSPDISIEIDSFTNNLKLVNNSGSDINYTFRIEKSDPMFFSAIIGADGADGAKGEKGDNGIQGPAGVQGIQGEQGDPGIIQGLVAGNNISIDNYDLNFPIINMDTRIITDEEIAKLANLPDDTNAEFDLIDELIETNADAISVNTDAIEDINLDLDSKIDKPNSDVDGGVATWNTITDTLDISDVFYIDSSGDLHINTNIFQSGDTYETHAEQLYTTKDIIITRGDAIVGMATDELTGIQAKLYDGTNDGFIGFDNNGVARVGDVGDLVALCGRDEVENLVDGHLLKWDATNQILVDSDVDIAELVEAVSLNTSAIDILETSATNHEERITQNEEDVENLQDEVASLQSYVGTFTYDQVTLSTTETRLGLTLVTQSDNEAIFSINETTGTLDIYETTTFLNYVNCDIDKSGAVDITVTYRLYEETTGLYKEFHCVLSGTGLLTPSVTIDVKDRPAGSYYATMQLNKDIGTIILNSSSNVAIKTIGGGGGGLYQLAEPSDELEVISGDTKIQIYDNHFTSVDSATTYLRTQFDEDYVQETEIADGSLDTKFNSLSLLNNGYTSGDVQYFFLGSIGKTNYEDYLYVEVNAKRYTSSQRGRLTKLKAIFGAGDDGVHTVDSTFSYTDYPCAFLYIYDDGTDYKGVILTHTSVSVSIKVGEHIDGVYKERGYTSVSTSIPTGTEVYSSFADHDNTNIFTAGNYTADQLKSTSLISTNSDGQFYDNSDAFDAKMGGVATSTNVTNVDWTIAGNNFFDQFDDVFGANWDNGDIDYFQCGVDFSSGTGNPLGFVNSAVVRFYRFANGGRIFMIEALDSPSTSSGTGFGLRATTYINGTTIYNWNYQNAISSSMLKSNSYGQAIDGTDDFDAKLYKDYTLLDQITAVSDGHLLNIWSTVSNKNWQCPFSVVKSTLLTYFDGKYTNDDNCVSKTTAESYSFLSNDLNFAYSSTNADRITSNDSSNSFEFYHDTTPTSTTPNSTLHAGNLKLEQVKSHSVVGADSTGKIYGNSYPSVTTLTADLASLKRIRGVEWAPTDSQSTGTYWYKIYEVVIGTYNKYSGSIYFDKTLGTSTDDRCTGMFKFTAHRQNTDINMTAYKTIESNLNLCYVIDDTTNTLSIYFQRTDFYSKTTLYLTAIGGNVNLDNVTYEDGLSSKPSGAVDILTNNYDKLNSADLISSITFSDANSSDADLWGRVSADGVLYINGNIYSSAGFDYTVQYCTFDISSILSANQEFNIICGNNNVNSYYNTCAAEIWISNTGSSNIQVKRDVSSTRLYFNVTIDLNLIL